MLASAFIILVSIASSANTALVKTHIKDQQKGFNYGSNDDYDKLFPLAKKLGDGFNTAKMFTAISSDQSQGIKPSPIFAAAKKHETYLLVGLYGSSGVAGFDKELEALEAAITDPDYGSKVFNDWVVGIIVGSEDLHRTIRKYIEPNGQDLGAGDTPENLNIYIQKTRDKLKSHGLLEKIPIGHADTWAAWKNETMAKVLVPNLDFIGLNSFPYWEGHKNEDWDWAYEGAIGEGTTAASKWAKDKNDLPPVWTTETGFPYDGPAKGDAVPSLENAAGYFQKVGCDMLFGPNASSRRNTWWFRNFGDGSGVDEGLKWGVLDDSGTKAAYELKCATSKTTKMRNKREPTSGRYAKRMV